MSLNPQITDRPPGGIGFFTKVWTGGGNDNSTFSAAYTAALADAAANYARGAFTNGNVPDASPVLLAYTNKFYTVRKAVFLQAANYHFLGISATCFLKAFWDEVLYTTDLAGVILGEVSRTSKELTLTMPSNGGVCLPLGFDHSNQSTWIDSGEFPITQPTPPDPGPDPDSSCQALYIEKFRWSQLDGYNPPDDGSANGFPV